MKSLIFVLIMIITSTMNSNVVAADKSSEQLNSIVRMELNASIKADRVLTERLLILDIKDDLTNQQNFPKITDEFQTSMHVGTENVIAINKASYSAKIAE